MLPQHSPCYPSSCSLPKQFGERAAKEQRRDRHTKAFLYFFGVFHERRNKGKHNRFTGNRLFSFSSSASLFIHHNWCDLCILGMHQFLELIINTSIHAIMCIGASFYDGESSFLSLHAPLPPPLTFVRYFRHHLIGVECATIPSALEKLILAFLNGV